MIFGRLQNLRYASKALVVHNGPKARQTALAKPNMGMSIFARSQLAHGVVEVKDVKIRIAADSVPSLEHCNSLGLGRHVIPSRRHVAGVKAQPNPARLLDILPQMRQLIEAIAQLILDGFPVQAVHLVAKKPQALKNADYAAVSISRYAEQAKP